jgi:hypothetical protein
MDFSIRLSAYFSIKMTNITILDLKMCILINSKNQSQESGANKDKDQVS